jgi:histidine ammonia-lyase
VLVKPASADSIVTSAGQEDHVSMGGFAARKASMLLRNMSNICAIELLVVFNAITQSDSETSPRLKQIIALIGEKIHPLTEDRHFAPDVSLAR